MVRINILIGIHPVHYALDDAALRSSVDCGDHLAGSNHHCSLLSWFNCKYFQELPLCKHVGTSKQLFVETYDMTHIYEKVSPKLMRRQTDPSTYRPRPLAVFGYVSYSETSFSVVAPYGSQRSKHIGNTFNPPICDQKEQFSQRIRTDVAYSNSRKAQNNIT